MGFDVNLGTNIKIHDMRKYELTPKGYAFVEEILSTEIPKEAFVNKYGEIIKSD